MAQRRTASGELRTYRKMRDFQATPEPRGRAKPRSARRLTFVVQKHEASHLHFDFRLEAAGVLKSWAVPKGPSMDPTAKRLAMPTEDHPMEYGGFEGTIPAGHYGAGTVMVWDTGWYENITEENGKPVSAARAIANGRIRFVLHGEKLRGAYALTRVGMQGSREKWLLVKMKDADARAGKEPARTEKRSALSGRTMQQIARAG